MIVVRAMLLVVLLDLGTSNAGAGERWLLEFPEGQTAAVASGKDLLIDFGGSDWCVPCGTLKERILSRPEFLARVGDKFVLIDIDLPATDRTPIPADRKQRYEALQERYGITTFPTVLLATPDGRAYARTTYRESMATPELFGGHLEALQERGRRLSQALARADRLAGKDRAEALAEGLGQVDPRFVTRFHADRVAELRVLDPDDATGYLAFLDGRRALDDWQAGLDPHLGAIDPPAVDSLIARGKLRGESLQEALVIRAAGEVLAGEDRRALATLGSVLEAQDTRTRFDRGDFLPLDPASIAAVDRQLALGKADSGSGVALDHALHRIFEFDLPNRYEESCGAMFLPGRRVREVLGDRYGRALIRSTEGLQGETRARALARGLEGTFFPARGAIREIVLERIPSLVGNETAQAILPGTFYPRWIKSPAPPQ